MNNVLVLTTLHCFNFDICTNSFALSAQFANNNNNNNKQHKEVTWPALGRAAWRWPKWGSENNHGPQILGLYPTIPFLLQERIT